MPFWKHYVNRLAIFCLFAIFSAIINTMCDVIVLPYKCCPGTSMGGFGNANWEWQSANERGWQKIFVNLGTFLYSHLGYNVPIYSVTEQRDVACSLASHTQPSVYFRKSQTTCSS